MCDTFAVVGATGTVFAKNSDRPRTEPQVVGWFPPRPAAESLATQYLLIDDVPTHGVLLSRPTWLWGAEHGVNEHGVAIGNERVYSARHLSGPDALIGMDLVRLGLERAAGADEALDVITELLGRHGQGGSCNDDRDDPYDSSFLIADARGGWVLETSGREWVAAPLGRGTAISNRYVVDDRWTRSSIEVGAAASSFEWHDERVDTRGADDRLDATRASVRSGPLDPRDAVGLLRHHGGHPWGVPGRSGPIDPLPRDEDSSGMTVCMHLDGGTTTTASMVTSLPVADESVRVWVCIGAPCVGVYLPLVLPAIPAALSDEGRWRSGADLRERVERDPATLADVRSSMDPLETQLWARADEMFARGASKSDWSTFADAAVVRVDEMLASLSSV